MIDRVGKIKTGNSSVGQHPARGDPWCKSRLPKG
nr:MAG TPA: hypothetical protein [Caudoviricetes sp.]